MVPEAPLEQTEHGLKPVGHGWFVLNAREAPWRHREGRGESCPLTEDEGADVNFPQIGVSIYVLGPGEPIGMYHWEANQEDFLVLYGEALLIVEGQERRLRPWDFVHCPPDTQHMIVGAGAGPCGILALGARPDAEPWGGYTVDPTALRHGIGVEEETDDSQAAYSRYSETRPTSYDNGWLPSMEA